MTNWVKELYLAIAKLFETGSRILKRSPGLTIVIGFLLGLAYGLTETAFINGSKVVNLLTWRLLRTFVLLTDFI